MRKSKKTVLAIAAMLAMNLSVLAQSVQVNMKDVTVKKAITELKASSGYSFVYSSGDLDTKRVVSVNATDLRQAVDQILQGQGVTYEIKGKNIIISKPEAQKPGAQKGTVSGQVLDELGEPVAGANVIVPGTTTGVTTDIDGNFVLNVAPGTPLQISFIGYSDQSVTASSNMKIKLQEDSELLEDVVVIGYGQARKKDLTGAVTQIKPSALANEAPKTVQDVLRGTAGLNISMENSAKGGGSMSLRGQRSVYTSGDHNAPLIILDGMMFYGELSEINTADIAQIDVLKDASSAAVYGAKSANGVIIITTKKGAVGKPTVNFSANWGFATVGDNREVYDAAGYTRYYQDFYEADTYGVNPETGKYETYGNANGKPKGYYANPAELSKYGIDEATWRSYSTNASDASLRAIWGDRLGLQGSDVTYQNFIDQKTFDWYDHSFRTGVNQDYNVSISGASDKVNYYLSLGYVNNESAIKGDDYRSLRANMKINGDITSWLSVGANVNFQDRSDGGVTCDWQQQITVNSPFSSPYDSDGNLTAHPMGERAYWKGYNYDFNRQYTDLESGYTVFNAILNAKVKLPLGITYTFNASPRLQYYYYRGFWSSEHPDWSAETNDRVNRTQSKRYDWSLNNTINWDYFWDSAKRHHTTVTLVQEAEQRQHWEDDIYAKNILPSEALGIHGTANADKSLSSFNSTDDEESAVGYLARAFYGYDDRYMLTASFRRDGYSAFGTSNPYANFLSAAVAWTFTNEKFWNWDVMSLGKLRLSYGQNGNRSLEDSYIALANLALGNYKMGYLDASGAVNDINYLKVSRLANPNLEWEKSTSTNVGLDLGFWNNRLTASVEYYYMPTTDMIMNQSLPSFTGFTSITTNLGKVVNQGLEITINSQNIRRKNFEWNTSFTFSYNGNKIKSLYGEYETVVNADGSTTTKEKDDVSNKWFIGENVNSIWDYEVTGIWQADELEEAAKYGQRPGDPKVDNCYTADDNNGSPVYNNHDKKILGTTTAPVRWSLRNEFKLWNDWTLSFNIYSLAGHKRADSNYLNNDNPYSQITSCENLYSKTYWTPENPSDYYARINAKAPNGIEAPARYVSATFIRFENLSLAYQVPTEWTRRVGISQAKVFGTVRNLGCWCKEWEYGDPETGTGLSTRTFTLGMNLTF